jgi:proteasome lid subunit RPN8/RPN11
MPRWSSTPASASSRSRATTTDRDRPVGRHPRSLRPSRTASAEQNRRTLREALGGCSDPTTRSSTGRSSPTSTPRRAGRAPIGSDRGDQEPPHRGAHEQQERQSHTLAIDSQVLRLLEQVVDRRWSSEWCAYIAVTPDGRQHLVPVRNIGARSTFVVRTRDRSRIFKWLVGRGWSPLAFVHTHPKSAVASSADRASAADDCVPWLVVCREMGKLVLRYVDVGPESLE